MHSKSMFSSCFLSDTLMLEPMILHDCGHTFCKKRFSRVQQNPTNSQCPLCRKPMWSSIQLKTNFTLKKVVEKIEVKCVQRKGEHRRGSTARLPRCPHILIGAANALIEERTLRPIRKNDYAVISCEQCHQNTTVADNELHLKKTCSRGEIRCPLKCIKRPRMCGHKAL